MQGEPTAALFSLQRSKTLQDKPNGTVKHLLSLLGALGKARLFSSSFQQAELAGMGLGAWGQWARGARGPGAALALQGEFGTAWLCHPSPMLLAVGHEGAVWQEPHAPALHPRASGMKRNGIAKQLVWKRPSEAA